MQNNLYILELEAFLLHFPDIYEIKPQVILRKNHCTIWLRLANPDYVSKLTEILEATSFPKKFKRLDIGRLGKNPLEPIIYGPIQYKPMLVESPNQISTELTQSIPNP